MTTVITGSASGIGAAVRKRLEKTGDKVIGVDEDFFGSTLAVEGNITMISLFREKDFNLMR